MQKYTAIEAWVMVLQWGANTGRIKQEGCEECSRPTPVTHFGSRACRSGSLASGGRRAHCTCDACF